MSSILLRKDHQGQRAGVVISVPWAEGKTLIASGIGEWYDSTKSGPPQHTPQDNFARDMREVPPAMRGREAQTATAADPPHDIHNAPPAQSVKDAPAHQAAPAQAVKDAPAQQAAPAHQAVKDVTAPSEKATKK